jgi:branched-subunit amino acid ABC-type transport system permease component
LETNTMVNTGSTAEDSSAGRRAESTGRGRGSLVALATSTGLVLFLLTQSRAGHGVAAFLLGFVAVIGVGVAMLVIETLTTARRRRRSRELALVTAAVLTILQRGLDHDDVGPEATSIQTPLAAETLAAALRLLDRP